MKNFILGALISFISVSLYNDHYHKSTTHSLVSNSFQTGCFSEAKEACRRTLDVNDMADCEETALKNCPKWGENFADFVLRHPLEKK